MKKLNTEDKRRIVRKSYGKIADGGSKGERMLWR